MDQSGDEDRKRANTNFVVAGFWRGLYEELVLQGFSKKEAFSIVKTYIMSNGTVSGTVSPDGYEGGDS